MSQFPRLQLELRTRIALTLSPKSSQSAAQRGVDKAPFLTWVLLIYMATLRELDDANALFKLDVALEGREQPQRYIYASPRLQRWIVETLPGLASQHNIDVLPDEQFDTLAYEFCVGEQLEVGWKFRKLNPIGKDVWELKTADLRIFGWFCDRDCFIGVAAEEKWRLIEYPGMATGYMGEVVRFRENLNLDEPKIVTGENYDDVVSNWRYPPEESGC